MLTSKKVKELIVIYKIRYKLAKENNYIELAGVYAGVINDLKKITEG